VIIFNISGADKVGSWSVTLNGETRTSTQNEIEFEVPNGTYAYKIMLPSGYKSGNITGSVNATTAHIMVTVPVTATQVFTYTESVILVVLAIIVLSGGVFIVSRRNKKGGSKQEPPKEKTEGEKK